MLKTEGLVINPKRNYRLYREEGLQVRTKRREKLIHRVRYIEGCVAYKLYSVELLSGLVLRWMNMRWLEYRRSGVNHLARTALTPAHSYLDDLDEYAKSVSYITTPSMNPDA